MMESVTEYNCADSQASEGDDEGRRDKEAGGV